MQRETGGTTLPDEHADYDPEHGHGHRDRNGKQYSHSHEHGDDHAYNIANEHRYPDRDHGRDGTNSDRDSGDHPAEHG